MEKEYSPGKCDYLGSGKKNCLAKVTWEVKDGRFSMQGEIWQPDMKDCLTCGQCVDTVAEQFPNDAKLQRMLVIWDRWHLNDMRAGTPEQMAISKDLPYDKACELLKAADKYVVPGPDGDPYAYGSQWLTEQLPAEVIAEIESW